MNNNSLNKKSGKGISFFLSTVLTLAQLAISKTITPRLSKPTPNP